MRRLFIAASALALGCDSPRPGGRVTEREAPPDTTPAAPQVAWTVRPIVNAPRYFVLSGWVTNDTLWGLAGSNPVDVHATSGAGRPWGVRASGATRSPDGNALAWADTAGIWILRRAGRPRRVLRFSSLPQRPVGDPTFDVRWAPNGRRLLTAWADEGTVAYALVDTASGGLEPLTLPRLPGYGMPGISLWLDDRRMLFTVRATSGRDGTTGYRESGWRGDIAVHDLGTHAFERVTSVPDGVFLEPLAAWGDTIVAARRVAGDTLATFSLFDSRTWSETASDLPRGTGLAASDDGANVAVFRSDDILSQVLIRSRRPGTPSAAPVLIPGRVTGAAWSPNGRALAVSTMAEERIEGTPGDLRAVYRLSVIDAP
ncbi:MAG TPA: WD40 repeat domain-containing protein [Gemmatimonadaceae bacterium]|nr:WD40 repeat domain-containing protein [Gemmatimonadaceae bacterium]